MTMIFNFCDGEGPVPAHRHINPDGSEGGWVADTARVDGTVYVSPEARIGGNAQVMEHARVEGRARVMENARVWGHVRIWGNVHILDNARIGDNSQVGDRALIMDNAHIGGNAWVGDNAHILGNAQIGGNARVGGKAWVNGNARIEVEGDDYITLGPFGPEGHVATITLKPVLNIHVDDFDGGMEAFREYVNQRYGDSRDAKDYLAMADFIEMWVSHRTGMQAGEREASPGLKG